MKKHFLAATLCAVTFTAANAQFPTAPPEVINPRHMNVDGGYAASQRRFGTSIAIQGNALLVISPEGIIQNSVVPSLVLRYPVASVYSTATLQKLGGNIVSLGVQGADEGAVAGSIQGAFVVRKTPTSMIQRFTLDGQTRGTIETGLTAPIIGTTDDGRLYVSSNLFEPKPDTVLGTGQEQAPGAYAVSQTYTNPSLASNGFGVSIAASGHYVFIGAPTAPAGGGQGVVFVYDRATSALLFQLGDPGAGPNQFGTMIVPIPGGRILVRSGYGASTANAGDISIWDVNTRTVLGHIQTPLPGNTHFGEAIAVGDGVIAIGMRGNSEVASSAGAVYVYSASNYALLGKLPAPSATVAGEFGKSLAIGNKKLAVGAPGVTIDGGTGAVYIYALPLEPLEGWAVQ